MSNLIKVFLFFDNPIECYYLEYNDRRRESTEPKFSTSEPRVSGQPRQSEFIKKIDTHTQLKESDKNRMGW